MWFIDYLAHGMGFAFSLYQAGFYSVLPQAFQPYTDARIELMYGDDK